jgi:serine/threonine protein phosphatase 1
MKTLVIGDIHGCHAELLDLIDKAGLAENDQLIALGDLVDRGPDSASVLRFFKDQPRRRSLMGNHERKHLLAWKQGSSLSGSQLLVKEQFDAALYAEAIIYFETLPLFVELPEAILVHGGLEPGVTLEQQQAGVLTGSMSGEAYLAGKFPEPWYRLYNGDKPVVAGHHDYSKTGTPLVINDRVFLIDTGCCFGHQLTGLVLPDLKLISVKSRGNYWGLARQSRRRPLNGSHNYPSR